MTKNPASFSANQQPGDDAADRWHDLVAAVVAVKGSPRVRPPAAMLAGIERKLGFGTARAAWWVAPRVVGGLAAALVLSLGWMAWRGSATRDDGQVVASAGAPSSSSAETLSGAVDASGGGGVSAGPVANVKSPGAAQPAGNTVAANTGPASSSPRAPAPEKHQVSIAAATGTGPGKLEREGSERMSVGALLNSETFAVAQPSGRIKGADPVEPKSDFYVVGMVAAALQEPVSANPFESIAQPLEWTDWRSGYEFGVERPASETLALSATWTWQDPRNQSLIASAASDGPGVSASISAPPPVEAPWFGASASLTAPEPVAGSEARMGGEAPADEPKP